MDAAGKRVVGDFTIGRRDVIVEAAAAGVRERIDAGDVAADRVDPVRGDDVAGKRIAHDASPLEAGGQRIVNGDQVAAPVSIIAESPIRVAALGTVLTVVTPRRCLTPA